jgi:hypothetical protein
MWLIIGVIGTVWAVLSLGYETPWWVWVALFSCLALTVVEVDRLWRGR